MVVIETVEDIDEVDPPPSNSGNKDSRGFFYCSSPPPNF